MSALTSINDHDLEVNLKSLVRKERMLLHLILEYIREVDTRKIYRDRAYPSMYEYLTKELGYSGSAAVRRLEAARLMRQVPELADHIQNGSINLSQVGEFARAVKEKEKSGEKVSSETKSEILQEIAGLTTEQTQKVVACSLDIELKEPEKVRVQKDESVHLTLTFTAEQFEMLKKCKDKAAHLLQADHGDHSWSNVIELIAAQFLDSKEKTKSTTGTVVQSEADRKTLTPKMKKIILHRDQGCQFVDSKTGRMCGSTYGLQVDHKVPCWAGGKHHEENLQALCWEHNKAKYLKEAGIRFLRL